MKLDKYQHKFMQNRPQLTQLCPQIQACIDEQFFQNQVIFSFCFVLFCFVLFCFVLFCFSFLRLLILGIILLQSWHNCLILLWEAIPQIVRWLLVVGWTASRSGHWYHCWDSPPTQQIVCRGLLIRIPNTDFQSWSALFGVGLVLIVSSLWISE